MIKSLTYYFKFYIVLFIFIFSTKPSTAQLEPIPLGTWRSHFDYNKGKEVTATDTHIFYAAQTGLYSLEIATGTLDILDKSDGLADLSVSTMAYNAASNTLILAYNSGQIDLATLDTDGDIAQIKNIPNVAMAKTLLGSKAYNGVSIVENQAFLAADFGIVQIDLSKKQLVTVAQNLGTSGESIRILSILATKDSLYATYKGALMQVAWSTQNINNFAQWARTVIVPNNIGNQWITQISGQLIMAVEGRGIYKKTGGKWELIYESNASIRNLKTTGNSLFLLSQNQILKIDPVTYIAKSLNYTTTKSPISLIMVNNLAWVADEINGLFQEKENKYFQIKPKNVPSFDAGRIDKVVKDSVGLVWKALPTGQGLSISDNTEKTKIFGSIPLNDISSTGVSSSSALSLALDQSGLIWIGTTLGLVAVNPDPKLLTLSTLNDVIITPRTQTGNRSMQNEVVNSIAIDGANRKWLATNNGLFLWDETVEQNLLFFNKNNAPLPDNAINYLNIDQKTGEVFVFTAMGVVSYRSNATLGNEKQGETVKVFPNPVRPEYDGLLAIEGLVNNAWVKITDISGKLVYQTRANGGTASWNLIGPTGVRIQSGVYMVYSANSIGQENLVSKFVVISK